MSYATQEKYGTSGPASILCSRSVLIRYVIAGIFVGKQ